MRLLSHNRRLLNGLGLSFGLCLFFVACAGSKEIHFEDDGRAGAPNGGDSGSGASSGTGADNNVGGAAGEDSGVGAAPSGPTRLAVVPGGHQMKSAHYTLILTTGEAPGGNGVMTSKNYRLTTGIVSADSGH